MLVTAPISRPPALPPTMRQPVLARVFPGDEMLGGGDEIGEGVLLLHHPPVVVPLLAHLAAAADVGHGEDHAAVDQAEKVSELKLASPDAPYEP